jgi:hypothetical protein
MNFKEFCIQLEDKIISSYKEGVTLEQAERLAGEFLYAMMAVSGELKKVDLDARMKKSAVKALRAGVYANLTSTTEKKMTVDALDHALNRAEMVQKEQDSLDRAEVNRDELTRYYNIFREAHTYFRQIGRGKFE